VGVDVDVSIRLLAATVVALCVVSVAAAGGNVNASVATATSTGRGHVYLVPLPGNFSVESLLYAGVPDDFDVFVLLVTQKCYVEITQQDPYITGDVIAFGVPGNVIVSVSPECGHWEGHLDRGYLSQSLRMLVLRAEMN